MLFHKKQEAYVDPCNYSLNRWNIHVQLISEAPGTAVLQLWGFSLTSMKRNGRKDNLLTLLDSYCTASVLLKGQGKPWKSS